MKTNKLIAAGAMALSMAMTPVASLINAMPIAAANVSIEASGDGQLLKDHTFTAYQVFSGTVSTDNTVTDINWGEGINSTAFLTAIKANQAFETDGENIFKDCTTATDVAQVLKNYNGSSDVAITFARLAADNVMGNGITIPANGTQLKQGYYVIVDTTEKNPDVVNPALLEVVGGAEDKVVVELKNDKPTVTKKVKEDDHDVTNDSPYGEKYNDVADYNIGETIPFSFYSKVPTNISQYETYKYVFKDTMSKGLTLDTTSIAVVIGGTTLDANSYTVSAVTTNDDETQSFSITITDLKAISSATAGADIRVNFNASLNSNAVIGLEGNPNTVKLEYSNNPSDSNSTKETPEDTVIVFTYELDVNKVDNANDQIKLSDVEFELWDTSDKDNHRVAVVKDGKFVKWADSGESISEDEGTKVLKTGTNGTFAIAGLDAGTYYLKETKTVDGYVLPENPFEITITSTTKNDNQWDGTSPSTALTALNVSVDKGTAVNGDTSTGAVTATIKNSNRATLPETGGMGTTLIYGAGALMVAGAAVVYVTNKRTRKD